MANPEHLELLRQGVVAWNAWREKNPDANIDLSAAELGPEFFAALPGTVDGRVNLAGINWRGVAARESQLSELDLSAADLSYAQLAGAVFSTVDLTNAALDGADLTHAKFWGGHAPGASFWDAVLDDVVLSGADLQGANLTNASLLHANLEGADLSGAELWRANLEQANLGGATLCKANMTEIMLRQANLHRCDLKGANLYAANLSEALLDEADVRFADLRRANLTSANVTEIHYNTRSRYRGIRVASSYGSPRFIRTANDQNYIEELRAKRWDPFLKLRKKRKTNDGGDGLPAPLPIGEWMYWAWYISSDCGRSLLRWATMAMFFAVSFGCAFYALGEEAFVINSYNGHRMAWSLETMIYYSISIFTKVSTGLVTPVTYTAELLVMAAGLAGLVTLGGLVTILADKVARRA